MKHIFLSLMVLGLVVGTMSATPNIVRAGSGEKRKIVVFKQNVAEPKIKNTLIVRVGGVPVDTLNSINASVVYLSATEESKLRQSGKVERIEDDLILQMASHNRVPPPQQLPWGVDRINAEKAWVNSTGSGVSVGIIDSGIDPTHPDLAGRVKGGVNTVREGRSYVDDNGHGTAVAGVIAANDNQIGVVGVAPNADLYAIKAMSSSGRGYLSDIIEGIDWAITNNIKILNMSLGMYVDAELLHDAVKRANDAGIIVVAAAGNESDEPVFFPAAYPETLAVSALDQDNTLARFSARGPEIDFAAPGVNLLSTYKKAKYRYVSGTSFAAPHVAAVAALYKAKCGSCNRDDIKQRLESTAEDLGPAGRDDNFGVGLVDAEKIVQ